MVSRRGLIQSSCSRPETDAMMPLARCGEISTIMHRALGKRLHDGDPHAHDGQSLPNKAFNCSA